MRKEVKQEEGSAGEDGGEHQAVQYQFCRYPCTVGLGRAFLSNKIHDEVKPRAGTEGNHL